MIMAETVEGLTPLDIAGRHGSFEAALIFLLYFQMNFDIITDIFKDDKPNSDNDTHFDPKKLENLEHPWTIYRITDNNFSKLQLSFAKVFYWAGYFGDKQIC